MYLQTLQIIDEEGRCNGVKFYNTIYESMQGQFNSHGSSYIYAREYFKNSDGEKIGLEVLVNGKEKVPPHTPPQKKK